MAKEKTFKPLLAPNQEVDLKEIQYPIMASYKLDGIRCIFYKGQILSRSLKQIQNNDQQPVWYLNVGLDPEAFTPLESSFLSRGGIRKADHDAMDRYFFDRGLGNYVGPGQTISGFEFTNLDEGTSIEICLPFRDQPTEDVKVTHGT